MSCTCSSSTICPNLLSLTNCSVSLAAEVLDIWDYSHKNIPHKICFDKVLNNSWLKDTMHSKILYLKKLKYFLLFVTHWYFCYIFGVPFIHQVSPTLHGVKHIQCEKLKNLIIKRLHEISYTDTATCIYHMLVDLLCR